MGDLERYIFYWCSELLLKEEIEAHRHFEVLQMIESVDSQPMKDMMCRKWLSTNSHVLQTVAEGESVFYKSVVDRLKAEKVFEDMLNYCPSCGGLTRSPMAKQCPHCFHNWH